MTDPVETPVNPPEAAPATPTPAAPESPKAEPAPAEPAKPGEPTTPEPKAADPKPAEPKAEAKVEPKPEETKAAEPAKPEEPKTEEPKPEEKPLWPDGWRALIAKDDTKLLKQLERFATPADLFTSYRALQQKLSSGDYKKALPEDATPEQLAEWRKDNGIPEKPEDYDLSLPDGVVIGEQDKPVVDQFLKDMHAINASPDVVKAALGTYVKLQEQNAAELQQLDTDFKEKAEDQLRAEWGQDYTLNRNLIKGLLATAPTGVADNLLGGRLANGNKIGDDPDALRFLVGLAREINPVTTVVPNSGANTMTALADEIATIEKMMGDKNSDYWKGPKVPGGGETKMQVRYRELINARDRVNSRAA